MRALWNLSAPFASKALAHTRALVTGFVMNIWNFCTMTATDLFTHVFSIYGALFICVLSLLARIATRVREHSSGGTHCCLYR